MAYRASEAFTTWVGGYKRRFALNDIVPDEIAVQVLVYTYDDGSDTPPAPKKRAAKKAAAKSDD